MINMKNVKKFCKGDYTQIENYEEAVNDKERSWNCHHRDEVKILPSGIRVFRTVEELKENGRYYDCPPNELIFLTMSEHRRLHRTGCHLTFSERHNDRLSASMISDLGKRFLAVYGVKPRDCRKVYLKEKKYFRRFGKLSVELTKEDIDNYVKTQRSGNVRKFLNCLDSIKEALNEYNIRW